MRTEGHRHRFISYLITVTCYPRRFTFTFNKIENKPVLHRLYPATHYFTNYDITDILPLNAGLYCKREQRYIFSVILFKALIPQRISRT